MSPARYRRAAPFGFQMLAYDPYIEELVSDTACSRSGSTSFTALRHHLHACARHQDAHHMLKEPHFKKMKKTALFMIQPRLDGRQGR
jgi:D-3-phosphoglycerate dehydrogenase